LLPISDWARIGSPQDSDVRRFDDDAQTFVNFGYLSFLHEDFLESTLMRTRDLHPGMSLCTSQSESNMPIVDRLDTFPVDKVEMFQWPEGKSSIRTYYLMASHLAMPLGLSANTKKMCAHPNDAFFLEPAFVCLRRTKMCSVVLSN
jgi:hypothetical protein